MANGPSEAADFNDQQRRLAQVALARGGLRTFMRNTNLGTPAALGSALTVPARCLAVDPEQVLLDPEIFRSARHSLAFKPSADMFASASHHQLPRYYSKDSLDTASAGVYAFQFSWKWRITLTRRGR